MCQALRGTPSLGRAGSLSVVGQKQGEKSRIYDLPVLADLSGGLAQMRLKSVKSVILTIIKLRRLTASMMFDVLRAMC